MSQSAARGAKLHAVTTHLCLCSAYHVSHFAVQETRIIMEFCDMGSLDEAIQQGRFHGGATEEQRHTQVDLRAVCLTLLDIVAAMTHLHSMRIVHKDLKPKNVLLSSCPVSSSPRPWVTSVLQCLLTGRM